jgi:hypothetical protein
MEETLQKFLPLLPLGRRIRIFRMNLEPPASKNENENIISYFGGRKNLNFRVFSQSSGLKGTRKYSIAQAQGVRSARGRTASAGKHPHSGAVA